MKTKYYTNPFVGESFSDGQGKFYMKRTKTKWSAHYIENKTAKSVNFDNECMEIFDSFVADGIWKEVKI